MKPRIARSLALILLSGHAAMAAIPVSGTFTYVQDFNSLPVAAGTNWTDDMTMPGWWLHRNGTSPPMPAPIQVSNGTDSTWLAGLYSLGAAGISERSLGCAPTTTHGAYSFVTIFTNTGKDPLRIARIKYDVEVWRSNSTPLVAETIRFSNKTAATEAAVVSSLGSGWIDDPVLDYSYPGHNVPSQPRPPDGATVERAPGTEILLLPGHFVALRWSNSNEGGSDAYVGIDNVTVEFVGGCALSATVSGIARQQNGTPGDRSDDTFSFDVRVTALAAGNTGWSSTSGPAAAGAYGSTVAISRVPVSASPLTFTVSDRQNPACTTSVVVDAPFTDMFLDASITFTEPPEGAQNYVRTENSRELGWTGGTAWATVKIQPVPNGRAKYFDITNARPALVTEAVNVSLANEFQAAIELAAYTSSDTAFEANDSIEVQVQTAPASTGPWLTVATILDPNIIDGKALFDEIKVSDPGIRYDISGYPQADFPFVKKHSEVIQTGTATHARLVLTGGNDSVSEHLLVDNIVFYVPPEIVIEQPAGMAQTDGAATVDFGGHAPGGESSLTFIVRNTGEGILFVLEPELAGTHPGDFTVTSAPAPSLVQGASTTFTIRFSPAGSGPRGAVLRLPSNDSDENPFDIILTGRGFTSLEGWRLLYFGTRNNSGPAADRSDPDGDGIANLVEFAFAMNPVIADAATLPQWQWNGSNFSLEFTRPAGTDGLIYRAEWSTGVNSGTWTGIPNSVPPPQFRYHAPAGTGARLFLRMRIVAP